MTEMTSAPVIARGSVTFRLPDPHARLRGVRLQQEVRVPGDQLNFRYRQGLWRLRLPRPAVDRMEYLFELRHRNDDRQTMPDPANPRRAPGAFGEKSVIEFPEYRPPRWLDWPRADGSYTELRVYGRALDAEITGQLWTPAGLTGPAPLLVAHDGPEYAALGGLQGYLAALIEAGELPPIRLALLAPGDRNNWYAANPDYARVLAEDVLPALAEQAPHTVRVGAGASLGGLAMLHAHRSAPGGFGALFLQSSSFFTPELDPQERRFSRFEQVTRFVAEVAGASTDPDPVPVAMTCGGLEENLANNRAMADTLRALGYAVTFREVADVHNFTAWRDAFDPSLTELLRQVCDQT
ncbi:MAG TPA: alpha/beta hydrolase-fold protein [Jatrophihabitans sp.]|nr:alpha/beta hydrolase-fold protein [Jatrophihabitans sp.]